MDAHEIYLLLNDIELESLLDDTQNNEANDIYNNLRDDPEPLQPTRCSELDNIETEVVKLIETTPSDDITPTLLIVCVVTTLCVLITICYMWKRTRKPSDDSNQTEISLYDIFNNDLEHIEREGYISELWIQPNEGISRLAKVIDALRKFTKDSLGHERAVDINYHRDIVQRVEMIFQSLLGSSGSFFDLRGADVDEEIYISYIVSRLEEERARFGVCKKVAEKVRSIHENTLSDLSGAMECGRSMSGILSQLSLCRQLERQYPIFSFTGSSTYKKATEQVSKARCEEMARVEASVDEELQNALHRLAVSFANHVIQVEQTLVIAEESKVNQIEQVTQEMQRVTDEGSETQLQDQQTQREAKVSAEIITREGAQWMMEHDRLRTESAREKRRAVSEVEERWRRLDDCATSESTKQFSDIRKLLDFDDLDNDCNGEKNIDERRRQYLTEDRRLKEKRQTQKGYQNSIMYYFFCAVGICAAYCYCCGSLPRYRTGVAVHTKPEMTSHGGLIDADNFKNWVTLQAKFFCVHLSKKCAGSDFVEESVKYVHRYNDRLDGEQLVAKFTSNMDELRHISSEYLLETISGVFSPTISVRTLLGRVVSYTLQSFGLDISSLKHSLWSQCLLYTLQRTGICIFLSYLLFWFRMYKFAALIGYGGSILCMWDVIMEFMKSSWVVGLMTALLAILYGFLLNFDERVSWRIYVKRTDGAKLRSINLRVGRHYSSTMPNG